MNDTTIAKIRKHWSSNLASYLETPIKDEQFLMFLANRMKSFSVLETSIPVTLSRDYVFDLGGDLPNDSLILACIDLEKSQSLLDYLKKQLLYDATSENTFAAFLIRKKFDVHMSKKIGAPTFLYQESIMIATLDKQKHGVHILKKSGLQTLISKTLDTVSVESGKKLDDFIPSKKSKFTELYNKIAMIENNQWSFANYRTQSFLPMRREKPRADRIFQGEEYQIVEITSEEASKVVPHVKRTYTEQKGWATKKRVKRAIVVSSIVLTILGWWGWFLDDPSIREYAESEYTKRDIDRANHMSQHIALILWSIGLGILSFWHFGSFSRIGRRWDRFSYEPARATEANYELRGGVFIIGITGIDIEYKDPTGELRYGPTGSAGSAGCSGFHSMDSCKECCTTWYTTAHSLALAAFLACLGGTFSIGAGWCWAAYLVVFGALVYGYGVCRDNCEIQYWHQY